MRTEIIVIADRSGSMRSIWHAALTGFRNFVEEQRSVPGEARLSLVMFDTSIDEPLRSVPLEEATPGIMSVYPPRGNTALYDAIGKTLNSHKARIDNHGWANQVIVCILTDGEENQSKVFRKHEITQMISDAQERDGWHFVFLAANQDAFATGASLGIKRDYTYNFAASASGTEEAYMSMSTATRALRGITF